MIAIENKNNFSETGWGNKDVYLKESEIKF